jgi:amino acid adenylation domain-containing protein
MTANTVEDLYELSPLQQGMLFHTLSAPADREMYVAQRGYDLHGRLDAEALAKAWRDVVARHPALRTTYHWEGLEKPLQVVHRDVAVDLEMLDWRDVAGAEQRERLDRAMADDRAAGFDLARAPLMRLTLVRLGDQRFHFVWTHHMILLDGWSVPLVVREIMLRYAELTGGGVAPGGALRPAPPYRDYIAWLQSQDQAAAERYWRTALTEAPAASSLARGCAATAGPVEVEEVRLTAGHTAALKELAARHRVTLNTVVQACWGLVLARHAGTEDAVFGMTTSGRPPGLPGVEGMVGLFINTLPLRVTAPRDGTPVGDWLAQTQQRQSAARQFEYSSLPQIRRWSGAPQGRPLFDSIVVFESYPVPAEVRQAIGDLRISTDTSVERTSEPLTVVASAEPDLTIRLLHHADRFDPGLIPAVARQLRTALEHLIRHPDGAAGDIALITADEYVRESAAWNTTRRGYPGAATLHGLVAEQARRTPGALAVWSHDGSETYAGLDARAERRAAALRARGAGPGSIVAVSGARSVELVVSLLAVLKAGAAYLPLDPRLPAGRMRLMLDDSGAVLVLADRELPVEHPTLPMRDADAPAGAPAAASDDPAYVIYTSGSTGTPKGVPITHRQIRNRLLWMQETFGLTADDRVLQKTPYDFDVSVWEFFWPLITGARLVLAAPDGQRDPAYLVRTIAEQRVSTVHFVPSMLRHFLDEPGAGGTTRLRRVFCSGEALTADLRDRIRRELPGAQLHNLYGPTEATVDVTWWDCARDAPEGVVPIGFPVANTGIHVLDHRSRPVPVGVPGELCIGGVQVTTGYLNRPGLNRAAFVDGPPGAGRLYRSGDLARRLPGGELEYLGRLDHQVKIRGLRIEPGEIEHALREHPRVEDTAVVAYAADGDDTRLAGYVVLADPPPAVADLRAHLAARLPAHLVPAVFVPLDALPLSANGKLDRAALPAPRQQTAPVRGPGPLSPAEARIAAVFADVLGSTPVDAEDSFFDLGGDSFQAIRAVRDIPGAGVAMLLQHPTPRALAAALADPGHATERMLVPLTPGRGAALRTLVCVPYGGGHAIAFRPLAERLPETTAVHAVRLPGRDTGEEELQPLETVAQAVTREILDGVEGPLALYGHCIGVALTTRIAQLLQEVGRPVDRVLLGGSFPFPTRKVLGFELIRLVPFRRRESDERILRYLQSLGGFEDIVDAAELTRVMAAFRHDGQAAGRWFTAQHDGGTVRLDAPITFVAGDADPETRHFRRRFREWERFSRSVDLAVVPRGGHYFVKHQAAELAAIVEQAW